MKGEGRAFCAGGDIVHIYESGINNTPDSQEFFYEEYILNYMIGTLKTPHIAILNGITSILLELIK
jgi:enoyl-CoA hydratase